MSKKPGVMIYHDIKPSLELMTDEDCGVLLRVKTPSWIKFFHICGKLTWKIRHRGV